MAIQGTHVEYVPTHTEQPTPVDAPREVGPRIVRVFSSELAALRSAVKNGNRHIRVEFGQTIEEAIEKADPAVRSLSDAASRSGNGPKSTEPRTSSTAKSAASGSKKADSAPVDVGTVNA